MGNKAGKLSSKEVSAITAKTSWNKSELETLHKEFLAMDADNSGELDFEEFKALFASRMPMDEAGYKSLFAAVDTDNSGTVSFKELATSLNVLGKGTAEDKLRFVFELYDTDGNGSLDKKEVETVLSQMRIVSESLGRTTDDFSAALIAKLDKDGDGEITEEEWVTEGSKSPSLMVLLGIRKM